MILSCAMAIMDKTVSNDFWGYNLGTTLQFNERVCVL